MGGKFLAATEVKICSAHANARKHKDILTQKFTRAPRFHTQKQRPRFQRWHTASEREKGTIFSVDKAERERERERERDEEEETECRERERERAEREG